MKRVLAIILCLLCTLFILVACGDNSADTDNTDKGHVHTFKTNEDWSKDSKNHWYEATCDCEDVTVTKLNHTDANNDGACDVCKFVIDGHEHEYSEEWTADCTNHWNSASCGHTVAGINVGAHTPGEDGKCTVCKYTVEDLHQHIYDTNWTYGDNYHWHAALCEHKSEITDKSACTVNDAGMCTVCNTVIKPIDKTDILAILKAAVANNFKVVSGNVYATEQAYEGKTVESGKSEEIFYVLGNGASYIKLVSYDKNDKFGGTDQYWFQLLENGDIFGVQMPYTHPNEEKRNTSLQLFPVSGDIDKLSGYTYIPGGILAKYEDNTTLAQTIFDLYDIMTLGTNVINATSSYNEKTGEYTFSYDYFTVNETKGNTAQDGSGEEIISYYVEYFKVSVLFTVNSDYVINFAEFEATAAAAHTYATEAVNNDPRNAVAHYVFGKGAEDVQNWPTALGEYNQAVQADSDNYLYYYGLGKVQYRMGKFSEARASFETCCKLNTRFENAQYNLGMTLNRLGRRDDAIAAYRKAYSINPMYDKAYLEAARLLDAKNDSAGAITAYQQVIRLDSANTSALRELGTVYAKDGRYQEAEQQFRKALALSADDPLTNYNLSTTLYGQDKLKDSLTYAQKAYITAKSDSKMNSANKVSIVYNYALLLDESGRIDDSIPVYQEALKLDARHVRSLINLGNIFLESGDGSTALTFLMKAVALDPSNFEANNNMGKAYLQQKDYRVAVDYFQTALKLDSNNNDVRANLARAYASAEDYENAKTMYTEVIKADNRNWDAYIELAKVCMSLNDGANAEKYLVYVQEKNPGYRSSEVQSLLSSL